MSGIKTIRSHFGLSQQQLAAYLDVSRCLLSLAETNRRSLPVAALLKLAALQKTAQANASPLLLLPELQKKFTAQVAFEIKELQYQATVLQRKLDTMKEKYGLAMQKKMLSTALQAQQKLPGKDAAWQQLLEAEAKAVLNNNHEGIQAILQIKINCLQQEAKALAALLQTIS